MTTANENAVSTEETASAEPTVAKVTAVGELIETAKSDPEGSVTVTTSEGEVTIIATGKKPRSKETKPRIRLTEGQALEIIKLYDGGKGLNQKELAKRYNVTQGAISHIVTGKRWARLKRAETSGDASLELVTADNTPAPTSPEADA